MNYLLKPLLATTALAASLAPVALGAQTPPAPPADAPAPAEAAPGAILDEAEALAVDAKHYATEYGVSFDEAVLRLTTMIYGTGAAKDAAAAEGTDLAGRYFDNNAAEFGLVVSTRKAQAAPKTLSFTPRTKENYGRLTAESRRARNEQRKAGRQIAKLSEAEVAKAEDVLGKPVALKVRYKVGQAHSLVELSQAVDALSASGASIPGFQMAFVDEMNSRVSILTKAKLTDAQAREVRQKVKVPVEFEFTPTGLVQVANMRGGSKLYFGPTDTSASSRACMTSFGVRHGSITTSTGAAMTGMMTAAHCTSAFNVIADDGRNYTLTHGPADDTRGGLQETDIMFVHGTNNNPVGLGTFYYDGTTNLRAVSGAMSRGGTAVGGGTWNSVPAGSPVGSYVCHLGQTSPGSTASVQSCGEVISVTAAQDTGGNATQNGGYFVMVRNTQSGKGTVRTSGSGTLRCYRGDSGGPWFAGTVAYGAMSSCAWADVIDGSQAAWSVYTSTDYYHWTGASIIVP
ncbi:MAG TPA: hypothetical protein VE891_05365 [Allosphingosinicella sp.]|nr:hypothetical protein [Allosphingosinicella sp.]